jgi:hypothetical protein
MYVLQIKRHKDEARTIDKYKARLVALGCSQTKSSYDKIKSPTARSSTCKLLMALQAKLKLKSRVLDVTGAYLKAEIAKSDNINGLYLAMGDGRFVMLKKYLYGLKQSGLEWNKLLARTMADLDFERSSVDECLFTLRRSDGDFIIFSVHVDDLYMISNRDSLLDQLCEHLKEAFGQVTVKDGDLLEYLGMTVETNPDTKEVRISQPGYIEKMLEDFGMQEASIKDTPMSVAKSTNRKGDAESVDVGEYLTVLGTVNYLAVFTRPDILYPVSVCAQRCVNPTRKDRKELLGIVRYLKGTKDRGLIFKSDGRIKLTCFVDASHGCYDDGKGHMGMSFHISEGDAAFYAKSQKLKIVTLSSTETEYVALCEAATEVVFLRQLLWDMGFEQEEPTIIYEDNKSAIDMVNGNISHKRSKHINIKYHYTREQIQMKNLSVVYCPTGDMIADVLTKSLSKAQHDKLTGMLMNIDI